MAGELFKKYYSRLAREGLIKSLLCGLIVGFSTLFVFEFAFWLSEAKLFWLAIVLFVVATAASAPIFYFKKFKPTTKEIARRVDELGLEERVLTMTELEGDESYIAMRQREDAIAALKTVNASLLTVIVSVPMIVATCILGVFGAGMTTVTALSASGVIKSGKELIEEATAPPIVYYEIEYEVDGMGMVVDAQTNEDMPFQVVESGKDAIPVMAVAEEDWEFVEWSDGSKDPYRTDLKISKDLKLIAYFEEVPDSGDGGEDGDEPGDKPKDGDGNGNGKKPGQGSAAGGEYKPSNQIIDGETFYGHEYEAALEEVLGNLAQNADMPSDLKELIANYFETIKTTPNEENTDE